MPIRDYIEDGYWESGYVVDYTPAVLPFDASATVISQYANSPTLLQLIDCMSQYFDPATDFQNFYDSVWNIDTAQGFGLDIWGKIVNVSRNLTIPNTITYFGFSEATGCQPFDQAPFYSGSNATQTYTLTDDAYRTLILAKAMANISRSSAQSINTLLRALFANRGRCYVNDIGGMRMMFTFEFTLQPYEIAILTQSKVIPKPAGVSAIAQSIDTSTTFGFAEQGGQPFDTGIFFNPDVGLITVA